MTTQTATQPPRGHLAYLGTGGFRRTDNTADFRRWQLYLHDERAPLGWENRGLDIIPFTYVRDAAI